MTADPLWVAIASSAAGAAAVGYLAKVVFERGVLRWRDEVDRRLGKLSSELAAGEGRAKLLESTVDKSFASIDKRLEVGVLEFRHLRELVADLATRVKELEQRVRLIERISA